MPGQTVRLAISNPEIVNRIPASSLRKWPEKLPVFRRKRADFPAVGLQTLVDQSCFAGTNVAALLNSASNRVEDRALINIRTPDGLDYFFVNPQEGRVLLYCGTERGGDIPPPDAVPPLETVRDQAIRFAELLGVPTAELERKPDGSIRMIVMENDRIRRGIKHKASRSVTLFRTIAGYPILALDPDKIQLQLGVNGRLLKFDLKWCFIEPARTNHVLPISKVLDGIRQGCIVGDVTNEYPPGGIARIEIKDIRVVYVVPNSSLSQAASPNGEIWPAAFLHAVFKSKTGEKTEGGLFAPILVSE
ncbi:MAG: hypothetical protein N2379_06420 [Verrucomicrobiae bacterium]|nr:hypothetical protein [Verrucomicrobiae bacterium]